MSWYSGSSPLN